MRKIKYQVSTSISDNLFLHYNSFNNKYLLLNKSMNDLYENESIDNLKKESPKLFDQLVSGQFIVEDKMHEEDIAIFNRLSEKMDSSNYHIVINTTLDCNLRCWYCYEHKLKNSKLTPIVMEAIKKNIAIHYEESPYSTLKMSFFGGEPFMNANAIKEILSYANKFCNKKQISLIADFTTNSTLINKDIISFLKNFTCSFQITLDGDRTQHNHIKNIPNVDSYALTLNNIKLISDIISNSHVWLRINYDESTLTHMNKILDDIDCFDRNKVSLIIRKIWQLKASKINRELLLNAIQAIFDKGFIVDCYPLTIKRTCFAEHINQVLFNYDGQIFKCSTLSSFDKEHAMGILDFNTGKINWDKNKLSQITKNISSQRCISCGLYASCYGACNKNLLAFPKNDFCILNEINMSMKDYLMYNFKLNLLWSKYETTKPSSI